MDGRFRSHDGRGGENKGRQGGSLILFTGAVTVVMGGGGQVTPYRRRRRRPAHARRRLHPQTALQDNDDQESW